MPEATKYYCSEYCQHNADGVCDCPPCEFVREIVGSGIRHGQGCALAAPQSGPTFTCPKCLMVSHHPNDVEYGYCGNCHEFTGEKS